jgi:hypothetical protein
MVETHGPARSWQGRIRDSIHMQTHQSEGGGYVRTALVIDVTGISATAQHRSTYRSGGGGKCCICQDVGGVIAAGYAAMRERPE